MGAFCRMSSRRGNEGGCKVGGRRGLGRRGWGR